MRSVIIVEGKNDRSRLRRVLREEVGILCTYGTPGTAQLELLRKQAGDAQVFIFTDNDASGKRIRGMLRDQFPDAEHIYTRRGYPGVEKTPPEYLLEQLQKAGFEEELIFPEQPEGVRWSKEDGL
ncbi:toprim domain-containing protein [Paenibacillus pasadenensis]|uniref:Toprim domain protein n=1 Tax=Paenibacillus pasadenensis TaxID=217090 RepID=A0A2N5NAA6_9BACL|nr:MULTISPECIES: toprim domain-containing protein [Paenibacillus]PLT47291.1 Toprim domain protein [Paenibacillus pasadenensis]QGG57586.1 DNA primase [Paenibacillus sp. B01]